MNSLQETNKNKDKDNPILENILCIIYALLLLSQERKQF